MALDEKLTEDEKKIIRRKVGLPKLLKRLDHWEYKGYSRECLSLVLWIQENFNYWGDNQFRNKIEGLWEYIQNNEFEVIDGKSISVSYLYPKKKDDISDLIAKKNSLLSKMDISTGLEDIHFIDAFLDSKGICTTLGIVDEVEKIIENLENILDWNRGRSLTQINNFFSIIKFNEIDNLDEFFECSLIYIPNHITTKTIGRGNGGKAYRVYSEALKQYRVLKIIDRKKFSPKEAELMAKLKDSELENIVKIYDAGIDSVTKHGEPVHHILMEYVDGQTLEEILHERKLTPSEVLDYSVQILNGIQSLRKHGITHRDLNLRNIKVNSQGEVKILDFGIATDKPHPKAKDNRKYGTPEGEEADDLISFGLLVYKMVTGEHLVDVSGKETIGSDTYADAIDKEKQFLYQDGKLTEEYRNKIIKKSEEFMKKQFPQLVDTSVESILYKSAETFQRIILSALNSESLDTVQSCYSKERPYQFIGRFELIKKLKSKDSQLAILYELLERIKIINSSDDRIGEHFSLAKELITYENMKSGGILPKKLPSDQ